MQVQVLNWINAAGSWVWGPPMLVLLVGTGIFLTFRLRGLQIRSLWHSLYLALIKRKEDSAAAGDITHFQALMTALAATVGTGNIAGVATAIASGGPGALFWMWITGLFGMATKYAEAVLAVKYRIVDAAGTMSGGPMYYHCHRRVDERQDRSTTDYGGVQQRPAGRERRHYRCARFDPFRLFDTVGLELLWRKIRGIHSRRAFGETVSGAVFDFCRHRRCRPPRIRVVAG